jgi:hypothetical protein
MVKGEINKQQFVLVRAFYKYGRKLEQFLPVKNQ